MGIVRVIQKFDMYKKALNWLEALNQNNIVPGLERIQTLMKLLGDPQNELKTKLYIKKILIFLWNVLLQK